MTLSSVNLVDFKNFELKFSVQIQIQGVSGGIVNILGVGSMDYSE